MCSALFSDDIDKFVGKFVKVTSGKHVDYGRLFKIVDGRVTDDITGMSRKCRLNDGYFLSRDEYLGMKFGSVIYAKYQIDGIQLWND